MQVDIFPTTRTTLLFRLSDPKAKAWDEFFAVYGPVIYRMGLHRGLHEHDAEEVVQVVMRYFFASVAKGRFDAARRPFHHYLRRATNNVIRRVRNGVPAVVADGYPLDDLASDDLLPDAEWEQAEREERWQACVERLRNSSVVSPRDMEAFESYVLRCQPAEAVAKRLGITKGRLYTIKHEQIQRLRIIREQLDAEQGEA